MSKPVEPTRDAWVPPIDRAAYERLAQECREHDASATSGIEVDLTRGDPKIYAGPTAVAIVRSEVDADAFVWLRNNLPALAAAITVLLAEVDRLEAELAKHMRHPLDRKEKCPACGRMSRITTAGCDHCDLEDK